MTSLLSFPRVWIRRILSLSVNVLLSSVATFCLHDSGKTFAKSAKSFHPFAILSSWNDAFQNICSLHTLSFWVDLPRTVCGSVRLSVEKITPFVKIFDVSAIDLDIVERRFEPLWRVCGIPHCTWLSFVEKCRVNLKSTSPDYYYYYY